MREGWHYRESDGIAGKFPPLGAQNCLLLALNPQANHEALSKVKGQLPHLHACSMLPSTLEGRDDSFFDVHSSFQDDS